jgi:uncharacterized protein YggE
MKKLFFILFFCFSNLIFSQNKNPLETSYIEVIGTSKREIEPNQIFISITLSEKSIDNKKYSIEVQENKLYNILSDLNISKSKLTLSDLTSSIISSDKRKEIGFKQEKEFILILENGHQVSNFFNRLFEANIKEAEVVKIDHTDIVKINREVRIEAVKIAKEKAEYILNAVGNKIGAPLEIIEQNIDLNYNSRNIYNVNFANDETVLVNNEFKKIIISFSFKVKYVIE